jgi:hypothetical protein
MAENPVTGGERLRHVYEVTLILSYIGFTGVLQVTDRLVTQTIGGQSQPFDPASNKNLVFVATDGVAAIGYTGLSFLDGVHTDQWVAETILGRSLGQGPCGRPAMITGGGRAGWPSIGQAIDRLQRRLPEALARAPASWQRQAPTITVSGYMHYRCGRRPYRRFSCEIHRMPGLGYTRAWLPRYMYRDIYVGMCPSSHLSAAEWQRLNGSIGGRNMAAVNMAAVEELFLQQIRAVAARPHPAVGPDCMSILIQQPRQDQQVVRVRYRPLLAQHATFRTIRAMTVMPVYYSPWFLSPGMVAAPRIVGGGGTGVHRLGYYEVRVEGPELPRGYRPSGGLIHIEQSQLRRPRP